MKQMTIFDLLPELELDQEEKVLCTILSSGGSRRNTRENIIARLEAQCESMEDFLKREFGIGGKGLILGNERYEIWYNDDGMKITEKNTKIEKKFNWKKIAEKYHVLWETGMLYDPGNSYDIVLKDYAEWLGVFLRDLGENSVHRKYCYKAKLGEKLFKTLKHEPESIYEDLVSKEITELVADSGSNSKRLYHLYVKTWNELFLHERKPIKQRSYDYDYETYITDDCIYYVLEHDYHRKRYCMSKYASEYEKIEGIKDIYGIGGSTRVIDANEHLSCDYSAAGYRMYALSGSDHYQKEYKKQLSWKKVLEIFNKIQREEEQVNNS